MTDPNVASADAGAQPTAVENSVESIFENAAKESVKPLEAASEQEGQESENAPTDEELKRLRARVTKQDRRIGQLTAQKHQAFEELQKLKSGNATPQQEKQIVQDNKGVPSKLNQNNFQNYADYIEARAAEIADYKIDQKFAEHKGKEQQTRDLEQEQTWEAERSDIIDRQAEEFAKEQPEINTLFQENAELVKGFPKEIKHALLAADNAPLAFFNLAKEGKLEELGQMSLVDAKVEIRLAQLKQPEKPKTKAPAPLPASRGSVPASKPYDKYSPREAWQLLNPKD